jgi:hypothetical protein
VDGFDKEYVAAAERDFKHQVLQPKDRFEKLLEPACLRHTYPLKHDEKFHDPRNSLKGQEA